jgi:hypothetical protein
MGHTVGLDEHYFKPGENYVLQEYLKAVGNLTINEENRLKIKVKEQISKTESCEYIIKTKLHEKEKEIEHLMHNDKEKEDALATLSDQVMKLMAEVQALKKK